MLRVNYGTPDTELEELEGLLTDLQPITKFVLEKIHLTFPHTAPKPEIRKLRNRTILAHIHIKYIMCNYQ